eukprot:CAMPEP_0173137274 /NCGR_PEP_ID=MMETSP1105-20130129/2985_1 /TAXON_ID=2985 /ORGANISM="Ochromonas sp., Strain BG-1" /LENGTH=932 /DNA_ID=CAMNT_0014049623 /DNA_START=341 /DNA_END=3140 /DNA_ORIENTATION=+
MHIFKENEIGRIMLTRILLAISLACPEVGYCQGMNFVGGTLVANRLNVYSENTQLTDFSETEKDLAEKQIFGFMLELIQKNGKLGLQGLWGEKIPKLKLRVYQLDRFLRWNYPHLHEHFVKIHLSPEVLTAQWFVTLFSYSFPLTMTTRIWDYIFLSGWEGIFRLSVSILGLMQDQLLALDDMESVAILMKEWKKPGYLIQFFSFQELLDKASTLIINEEVLLKLQESFANEVLSMAVIVKYVHDHPEENKSGKDSTDSFIDITESAIVKKALPLGVEPPTFWLMRYGYKLTAEQATDLNNVHTELLTLDRQVDRDKQILQAKILKACDYHREVEEHIQQIFVILSEITEQLHNSQQQFHTAVQDAQLIATKASVIIDTLGSMHPDEVASTTANMSSLSYTQPAVPSSSSSTNSSSSTGFLPMKILHEGPLRKLLFKKRYAEARHVTESLNHLIEKAAQVKEGEEGEEHDDDEVEGDALDETREEELRESADGADLRLRGRGSSTLSSLDDEGDEYDLDNRKEDELKEAIPDEIIEDIIEVESGKESILRVGRTSSVAFSGKSGDGVAGERFAMLRTVSVAEEVTQLRLESTADYNPRLATVSVDTAFYTPTATISTAATISPLVGERNSTSSDSGSKRISDPLADDPLSSTVSHTPFLRRHSAPRHGRRNSEKELQREEIAQKAKRLSIKIDRLAAAQPYSEKAKTNRFSFSKPSSKTSPTSNTSSSSTVAVKNRQTEEVQDDTEDDPPHSQGFTTLYRYARRWAPIQQDQPSPPEEKTRDVSIDIPIPASEEPVAKSPPSSSFLPIFSQSILPTDISQKLSSSLGSLQNIFSSTFSSSSSINHDHHTTQHQRSFSTSSTTSNSPLPLKEIEEPTSSPSLLTQSAQLKSLEVASQKAQKRIIHAHRNMEYQKNALKKYQEALDELKMKKKN